MTVPTAPVIVAHAVLPTENTADILPLYLDGVGQGDVIVEGRHSATVPAGRSVSFGSYFNAFPAAYWRRHTAVRMVTLQLMLAGDGAVTVWRSDSEGRARRERHDVVAGEMTLRMDLPLADFEGGGCYWFDLAAGSGPLSLREASWSAVLSGTRETTTIAMATFNRPADCLRHLASLASDAHLPEVVDRIVVVDQGTDPVDDQPGFGEVHDMLGERLVLVRQQNLGGSGGFSRGMLEALERAESDGVLLLDDDAISEPEAIFRAVRFADAASRPIVVGGGMLHIDARSVLYTQSEQWDKRIGWTRLDRPGAYDHDFASMPFRDTPYFHAVQHSDYNGWWMCLIPLSLLRERGLALPVFLKGDDVEFGLRAHEYGVETVSPPGIALWHLGWGGKAPTRSWEAYFLHRNRLITELLHTPYRRPTAMIVHSFLGDMKPLLTLQYSAVRLRAQAVQDVFDGPDALPGWLATRVGAVRELWARYPDAVSAFAATPALHEPVPVAPAGTARQLATVLRVMARHLFVPAAPASRRRAQARIRATELGWWSFQRLDSALVETPDGSGVVWYRRSRSETLTAARRSIRLHMRLWWHWPSLARRFRAEASELTSPRAWAELFRR